MARFVFCELQALVLFSRVGDSPVSETRQTLVCRPTPWLTAAAAPDRQRPTMPVRASSSKATQSRASVERPTGFYEIVWQWTTCKKREQRWGGPAAGERPRRPDRQRWSGGGGGCTRRRSAGRRCWHWSNCICARSLARRFAAQTTYTPTVSQRTPSHSRPDQTAAAATSVVQQPRTLTVSRLHNSRLDWSEVDRRSDYVGAARLNAATVSRPHELSPVTLCVLSPPVCCVAVATARLIRSRRLMSVKKTHWAEHAASTAQCVLQTQPMKTETRRPSSTWLAHTVHLAVVYLLPSISCIHLSTELCSFNDVTGSYCIKLVSILYFSSFSVNSELFL